MTGPSPETLHVAVAPEDTGRRLDVVLAAKLPGQSRTRLQGLIRDGQVALCGRTIGEPGRRVKPGETYTVGVPAPVAAEPAGEAIGLDIVFEDAFLIVIDKPAGLVVHPAAGHASGTLVNALIAHCGDSLSGIGGVRRPGIVHRLDKDTSGLMVAAKTDAAHRALAEQFAAHGSDGRLERAYLAIVWGAPRQDRGRISAPLARKASNRTKMAIVAEGGRAAATQYEVKRRYGPKKAAIASLLRCTLETGRTHQIRVHLASLGHPVLGDRTYGAGYAASARALPEPARQSLETLGRQALHAASLGFEHPVTGKPLRFESPLPQPMQRLAEALQRL